MMPKLRPSLPLVFKITLLIAAFLFGFIACEIAIRVFLRQTSQNLADNQVRRRVPNGGDFTLYDIVAPSANSRLLFELVPDRSGMMQGVPYRSNHYGMRGADVEKHKPEGVWRIAGLGDSTMFGWRVPESQSYLSVLERALSAAGDRWRYELLNFAVPGYNTALEAEQYRAKVADFKPDALILQFDINDLALPNFIAETPGYFTLRRSFLFGLLHQFLVERDAVKALNAVAVPRLREGDKSAFATQSGVEEYFEYRASHTPKPYRYMVGWEGVERALNRLWEQAPEPILHLSSPYPMGSHAVIKVGNEDRLRACIGVARAKGGRGASLHYAEISRWYEDFCREKGLSDYADLVVDYPEDRHPSGAGHALIARIVYQALVREKLLPKGSIHYVQYETVEQSLWREAETLWAQSKRKSGNNSR